MDTRNGFAVLTNCGDTQCHLALPFWKPPLGRVRRRAKHTPCHPARASMSAKLKLDHYRAKRCQRRPWTQGPVLPPLDPIFVHLAGEGVAVDSERIGGLRHAPVAAAQDPGDEALLEFADGVLEMDAFGHHV